MRNKPKQCSLLDIIEMSFAVIAFAVMTIMQLNAMLL